MPHRPYPFSRSSMLRTLALFLVTTTACIPATTFAVEGYNVGEGEEWSQMPGAQPAARSRFTDLSSTPAPRTTPLPAFTAGPSTQRVIPRASLAETPLAAPSDVGLPALAPITLTPPDRMRSRSISPIQPVGLADTAVPAGNPYIPPVSEIIMPAQPLYPTRGGDTATPAPAAAPMPTYQALTSPPAAAPAAAPVAAAVAEPVFTSPPVVAAVEPAPAPVAPVLPPPPVEYMPAPTPAPAMVVTAPEVAPVPAQSEVMAALPPPPAMMNPPPAQAMVSPAPEVLGSPMASMQASPALASPLLSSESKGILGTLRPPVKVTGVEKTRRVDVKRVNPDVANIVKKAEEVYESAGVSIRVSAPQTDATSELENAYEALVGGDSEVAIRIYQELLQRNPTNEEALFGLAATYHRTGQVDNARPLYGRLLKQNPNHREGLNNFLMLVANESPREALQELATLEARNPDYSPIPAQMAILYDRLGEPEVARSKMLRAIEISPENWVYKYNLAIMLDRQRSYADAASIYRELVAASLQGEPIPVDMKALQARLNYIAALTGG